MAGKKVYVQEKQRGARDIHTKQDNSISLSSTNPFVLENNGLKERVILLEHKIAVLDRRMKRNEKDIWSYISELERAISGKR